MGDFVFNIAKGKVGYYCSQVGTGNAALIVVPIETTGIVADNTMKDYDNLSALLAGTSNEQSTMGRKTITTATSTIDDTNDRLEVDIADQTWTSATGNPISALVICYDSDTTTGTDANIIPLTKHDFVVTPSGANIVAQFDVNGFYRVS